MHRIVVPFALALALALPGGAAAAELRFKGDFSGAGALKFKLAGDGHKKVKRFTFEQVPITCDSGAETTTGHLKRPQEVTRRKFKARAKNDAGAKVRVDGKLKGKKDKRARGTLRISGTVRTDEGATGTNCETGELRWTASR